MLMLKYFLLSITTALLLLYYVSSVEALAPRGYTGLATIAGSWPELK